MSSFGSCGSGGGAPLDRTAGMLTTPKPVSESQPRGPTSRAVHRMRSNTCVLSRRGRTVHAHAAAPDTSGAAKLVASSTSYPLADYRVGTATGIPARGAARSMASDEDENDAGASVGVVAATVSTCG